MTDPRDTGGVPARSRGVVAPPPRAAEPVRGPEPDREPTAESGKEDTSDSRRSPVATARPKRTKSVARPAGPGAGARLTVNLPIGLRRWLRVYAKAIGQPLHEIVIEAADRHIATLRSQPPRAGHTIEDGVRVDFYLTGTERDRIETLARHLGWSLSETISELLELERRAGAADPDEVARRLAERLRNLQ